MINFASVLLLGFLASLGYNKLLLYSLCSHRRYFLFLLLRYCFVIVCLSLTRYIVAVPIYWWLAGFIVGHMYSIKKVGTSDEGIDF